MRFSQLKNMQRKVHFFSPVYRDLPSFLQLREKILSLLPKEFSANFHLLDDSAGEDLSLRELALTDVTVFPMPFNLGHQRALVYGLRCFLSKLNDPVIVVTMDADGEDRPEDLTALLQCFMKNEATRPLVLARRTKRKESLFFKIFYSLYKKVFRALTGTVIQTGNYAVLHSEAISRIIFHPYFDLAYASTLLSIGTNLHFVPCPRGSRYEGRSKMNFSRLAIHGVRMLMPFMDKIAIRGVVFFSLLFALSAFGMIGVAAARMLDLFSVPNWILLASILALALSFLAVCNFAILITIFTNVQGVAMSRLENLDRETS